MLRMIGFAVGMLTMGHASTLAAQELPSRKPGLWDLRMTMEGGSFPPTSMQHCIDAETDKMMSALGTDIGKEMCSKQDIQRTGSTITIDSVCRFGETTMTSRAVVTGSFDSAYTVKIVSNSAGGPKTAPQLGGDGQTQMTMDAKWLGACQAGQKPGDMIMQGGVTMNIRDMQQMRGAKPRG